VQPSRVLAPIGRYHGAASRTRIGESRGPGDRHYGSDQFVCGRVPGWKINGPKCIFPGMATIVQCNCGAEYRRTEEKFLVPHTGDAVCTVCGAALESWRESTHVPTYELIERLERKPE
jgi:hypothetical protein